MIDNKVLQMGKFFPLERRRQIVERVRRFGRVTVDELAQAFKVSGATIRRDLELLEGQGLVTRTHGGALSQARVGFEPDYFREKRRLESEKRHIARRAAALVEEGDVIFLEASTTVLHMVPFLRNLRQVTVMTNSVEIAQGLADGSELTVIVTGGTLRRRPHALIGALADAVLDQVKVDKAFMGISALDPQRGIATPALDEARTKKQIAQAGRRVIGLCDHSKVPRHNFAFVMPLTELDTLITDDQTPAGIVQDVREAGVEVIVAGTGES